MAGAGFGRTMVGSRAYVGSTTPASEAGVRLYVANFPSQPLLRGMLGHQGALDSTVARSL